MTDYKTPRGFVQAVEAIKAADGLQRLFFEPRTGRCFALPFSRRRPRGAVLVGSYAYLVLGRTLARTMREDLEKVMEAAGVPRGTRGPRLESKACRKNVGNAGRRSV